MQNVVRFPKMHRDEEFKSDILNVIFHSEVVPTKVPDLLMQVIYDVFQIMSTDDAIEAATIMMENLNQRGAEFVHLYTKSEQ